MRNFWIILLKPRAWVAMLLLLFLVALFFSLGFLDHLQSIKSFLDSEKLSFQIGESRFSMYLLIKALLTIMVLFWVTGIFSEFGERKIKNIKSITSADKEIIVKAFQILVYFLAFVIGINVLGIDFASLAIFGGAIGVGIGFGLQKITSNFVSGLILLFEKSVRIGDLVELSDGQSGFIGYTGALYTRIQAFDGREIMAPNEDFITGRVVNWTYSNNKARITINVGVSYDSDLEMAMELALQCAREHPRCIENPGPGCFLREFSDSSVELLLLFWVADVREGLYGPKSDVIKSIWRKFREHGVTIPYPQQDIHISNVQELK